MVWMVKRVGVLLLGLTCVGTTVAAQDVRPSRIQVTVVDPSGGALPGAAVTLTGLDPATRTPEARQARTDDKGVAVFDRLAAGRYSASAAFSGFDTGVLREIRTRAGAESRHTIVLPLQKLQDSVLVGGTTQESAADRRTSEFGLKLSGEQIAALSDDPADLQRQLAELAGPDAVVRVDSFEGQQLPPKAQIKSIHVTRDQFAAEAANPGSTFVDIITQPGVGPLRGGSNMSFRDGSMTGKSQFTDRRGAEQTRNFGANVGGTIIEGRTSFNASINGQTDFTTPILNVALPDGFRAETLNLRQPNRSLNANAVVDHALTRDQTLRVGVSLNHNKRENIGVGNYNLPERGYSQQQTVAGLRLQEAGPIGRRTFINSRLAWQDIDIDMHSVTNAPTIVVQDAFSAGGAQNEQFVKAMFATLASDVDHVRGIHSWRAGAQLDVTRFTATSRFNYLGTYTFASVEDYLANKPVVYTRSLGNPVNKYDNLQGAVYLQDDIRVRKGLTLSPGVRFTMQKRVNDLSGFAPRFGFTWSPVANGATTLRGSVGIFHGFLPLQMIEQTLRLNGELQREIFISNPSYPDPGPVEALDIPTNKYVIGDFNLQRNLRYSAGIDQVLSPRMRVNVLYNYIHLQQQPRGLNVNPLVNGQRPDPQFANVIEAVTDAEIRRHEFSINSIISLAAPSPTLNQARFNWRRVNLNIGYSMVRAQNNSDGPWAVPPTGSIEDDWGPGPADQPYRVQILLTSNQLRNVTANLTYSANAGQVYTETTGFDNNRDGFVTDRPAGVGLRSLRGDGQQTLNARFQYAFQMGPPAAGGNGARYRLNVFANIQNLTNHQNLGGYSGVTTSPFFRQPTFVLNPRRVDIGVGINF